MLAGKSGILVGCSRISSTTSSSAGLSQNGVQAKVAGSSIQAIGAADISGVRETLFDLAKPLRPAFTSSQVASRVKTEPAALASVPASRREALGNQARGAAHPAGSNSLAESSAAPVLRRGRFHQRCHPGEPLCIAYRCSHPFTVKRLSANACDGQTTGVISCNTALGKKTIWFCSGTTALCVPVRTQPPFSR